MKRSLLLCGCLIGIALLPAVAQQPLQPRAGELDRGLEVRPLVHTPLPEQYLWTAQDATWRLPDHSWYPWRDQGKRTAPHFFRQTFSLAKLPAEATLYIAGPREAEVFLNGILLGHFASDIDAPIGFRVFHADAARLLRMGMNTIAVSAVRGRGIVTADASPVTQQMAYGEVLAVKLLAAGPNRSGDSLLISDEHWRSTTVSAPHWSDAGFDDHMWPLVESLGGVESNRDLMQWSVDAGMYAWLGYAGMTPPLGVYPVLPVAITHVYEGQAKFAQVDALTLGDAKSPMRIEQPVASTALTDGESPALLLDFGREIAGRVLVRSASDTDAVLSIAYGESELEALATGLSPEQRGGNYLGTNLLEVPAHGEARGPKSGFRFVRVRFLRGGPHFALASIEAEGIAYPVSRRGSFESSDALLNRIWETSAYTAHLCMQDDLWDAPKRDRGRWAGDLDVEGRVIETAFGDKELLERTLTDLAPQAKHTNAIPGYTALWVTTLMRMYERTGDLKYLHSRKESLQNAVAAMNATLDANTGTYVAKKSQWPFVDWAPELYGPTAEAVYGTSLEYLRGYTAAAFLFDRLGDSSGAAQARSAANKLKQALRRVPLSGIGGLGATWQLNALGVLSGAVEEAPRREAVWGEVLSKVKQDKPSDQVISPYFNLSVLDAMAALGHRREALDWMRAYWGGMLAEGATSFWESYDLRWPKVDPHLSLQADGTSGFFVSMAHGWSAGPTAWLSENVLGIRDPEDGYRKVTLAPRLLGLAWAKGSVPTPHGAIAVAVTQQGAKVHIVFTLSTDVQEATLQLEPGRNLVLDGKLVPFHQSVPMSGTTEHVVEYVPQPR